MEQFVLARDILTAIIKLLMNLTQQNVGLESE